MKHDVQKMVAECHTCQQHKYETVTPAGLLQPLHIPDKVWTNISMDFIVGLPHCLGKSVIFVVVDCLSKYAHFIALSNPYSAATIAQLFVDHVFKLHGMPSSIVCDRDPIFVSDFWKEFFKLHDVALRMSSGYHPQTDGQTEVSLAAYSYHKLLPKFYGPYEILEKLGPVAYKLQLPTGCKIHPVFHVSCLKKHLGTHVTPSLTLPRITEDGIVQDEPLTILERKLVKRGNAARVDVLVHWKGHTHTRGCHMGGLP
ncbi:unnamed protein product [Prunus armeniaca]